MTVGKKLMICIAGMLAVVLGLAGGGWYTNQKLAGQLSFATENLITRSMLTGELRGEIVTLREKQRGIMLYAFANDYKASEANHTDFQNHLSAAKAVLVAIRTLVHQRQRKGA